MIKIQFTLLFIHRFDISIGHHYKYSYNSEMVKFNHENFRVWIEYLHVKSKSILFNKYCYEKNSVHNMQIKMIYFTFTTTLTTEIWHPISSLEYKLNRIARIHSSRIVRIHSRRSVKIRPVCTRIADTVFTGIWWSKST